MTNQSVSVLISSRSFLIEQGIGGLVSSMPGYNWATSSSDSLYGSVVAKTPDLLICEFSNVNRQFYLEIEKVISQTSTKILLIIAGSVDKSSTQQLVKQGVRCIVTDRCSEEEITNAVRAVVKGDRFMCSRVLDELMRPDSKVGPDAFHDPQYLSPREKEVLTLITQGHTTVQIADLLHVSVHTINSHRKNMLKKFNLKSPIELIVYALENNLVEK